MRRTLLAALCALPALACGGGSSDHPDAGKPDAGDPLYVFGLQTGACYEFSNTAAAQTPPSLGAAVESDSTTSLWYLPDGGSASVQARTLVFRQVGQKKMTDYLFLDGQDVLLLKRDVDGAEQTEYHPALIVARTPLKSADHLEQSDGGVRVFDGSGSSDLQPYDFTFDVQEATVTTPANPAGGDAFSYIYSVGGTQTTRLQRWSFAPGSGPVDLSLGLPGDTGVPQYQLQAVRQLAAGDLSCGSAPNP